MLGEAIRALRSAAGFSQLDFASQLKISASYLSLIENDRREPALPLLRRMSEVLGAPSALLFAAALVGKGDAKKFEHERAFVARLLDAARLSLTANRVADRFSEMGEPASETSDVDS